MIFYEFRGLSSNFLLENLDTIFMVDQWNTRIFSLRCTEDRPKDGILVRKKKREKRKYTKRTIKIKSISGTP
jgi:hypothetical protein